MSFILDALRKSEAQRRRGAPPALVMPQPAPVAGAGSRTLYYGLATAALVAIGIAIGAIRPWQAETPLAVLEKHETPRISEAAVVQKPSSSVAAVPAAPVPTPAKVRPQKAAPRQTAAAPVKPAAVIAFGELPVALQQEIPALQISAHAFSPVPRERLVGIGERVLREGDSVTSDLVLEQITPDGMIMSYKGQRFRRGVR